MHVDRLLQIDRWLINCHHILLDSSERLQSAGQFELFPPLADALDSPFLNYGSCDAILIGWVNQQLALLGELMLLELSDPTRTEVLLDLECCSNTVHDFWNENHEHFVAFVQVVQPYAVAHLLHERLVLSREHHDLLVVIEVLLRSGPGLSRIDTFLREIAFPRIGNETHILV